MRRTRKTPIAQKTVIVDMWGGFRQERNLINVPNPEGSTNPYAPKFDQDDTTGGTLILPVFFLYLEHARSDVIRVC
jgi:hypothetical protein